VISRNQMIKILLKHPKLYLINGGHLQKIKHTLAFMIRILKTVLKIMSKTQK